MTSDEHVQDWLDIAQEDLEVAQLCLEGGKYLHTAYMCQQAVEKALKARVAHMGEVPLPTHNLPALARDAEVWNLLDTDRRLFLRALTTYAIEARYPERKAKLAAQCTEKEAQRILTRSEEMVSWLAERCLKNSRRTSS